MKALVFGIDGGTERILRGFDMPFTHRLFKEGTIRSMNEDLFSRGWAEMVNGQTSEHTRAFYMGPLMDGTQEFSVSYKCSESEKTMGAVPIWRMVEATGVKAGVMNVPTSSPAQELDGFMVGSAGGGISKVEGLPESLAKPKAVRLFLEQNNYIVDIRLTTSGITDLEVLFTKLKEKERTRTRLYIELCKKYGIEFGFLVDRATTIVQYLCMSEIEAYLAMKSMPEISSQTEGRDRIFDLLEDFYLELDKNIEMLMTELAPQNILITADHNTVPYKFKGNMNAFLEEAGFLHQPPVAATSLITSLRGWAIQHLPASVRLAIKKTLPVAVVGKIDWKKTKAFGHDYIDGIYLNDKRFGGPVQDFEKEKILSKIEEAFHAHPRVKEFGLGIKRYRENFKEAKFQDHLPDLILEEMDELHIVGRGDFIYHNPNYGPLPPINTIQEDMFSGQKGSHPLFFMNKNLAELVRDNDPHNLTLVYRLMERVFNGGGDPQKSV